MTGTRSAPGRRSCRISWARRSPPHPRPEPAVASRARRQTRAWLAGRPHDRARSAAPTRGRRARASRRAARSPSARARPLEPRGRAAPARARPERADLAPPRRPPPRADAPADPPAGAAAVGRRGCWRSSRQRPVLAAAIVARDRAQRRVRVRPGAPGRARGRGARGATCRRTRRSCATAARSVVDGARARARATCSSSRRATASPPTPGSSTGAVEVDLSTLTGESVPVERPAGHADVHRAAAAGAATSSSAARPAPAATRDAVVFATGMRTELGRIAALSQRRRPRGEPARAPGPAGRLADRRGRGRRRARVPAARRCSPAGLPLPGRARLRDRPARRQRPRGAAADDHARARRRRARAGPARARSSSG